MPRKPAYDEAEVRAAVEGARSMKDALAALGLRAAGGNYETLRRLIAQYGLSTDHMDPNWNRRGVRIPTERVPLAEVMVARSTYARSNLKYRLFDEGLKQRECEMCGQGELWNGAHMSLVLDHINGVHDDNRLENLRVVCPNCNATLATHCGRHNQNGPRDCRHCGRTFQPRLSTQQYCSQICGAHSPPPRNPKPETRKVQRPPYEQLMQELADTNYSAVGRKYGVSDNAVRKWVRAYEYQRARAAEAAELATDAGPPDALAA